MSPCGGDLVGRWNYSGACVEDSVFTSFFDQYCGASSTTFANKVGSITGSIVFNGATLTRNETTVVSYQALIGSGSCLSLCTIIPSLFPAGVSGTCSMMAPGCVCDLTATATNTMSGSYGVDGGVIVSSAMAARYCRTAQTIAYRDQSPMPVAGTFSLQYVGPP